MREEIVTSTRESLVKANIVRERNYNMVGEKECGYGKG